MDLLFRGATSISSVADVAAEFRHKSTEQQAVNGTKRMHLNCSWADFQIMFVAAGDYVMKTKGRRGTFAIDKQNFPIVRQLYLYMSVNEKFEGDLTKGIMLQGRFGAGKTLIMESFAALHNHLVYKSMQMVPLLTFVRSLELQMELITKGAGGFSRRPLIVDELGRESKTIMDYGNIRRPLAELLSLRAEMGALTFGTTNFTLETLASGDFYGAMVGDRLRSMFNFMMLEGESRRI